MSEELSWRSLFVFEGSEELSQRVAEYILKKSNEAIQERGKFSVAFSGGSLPSLVARFLKESPFADSIEWDKWFVFFADERYVPKEHVDSNYYVCQKELFSSATKIPKTQIFPAETSLPLNECAQDYEKKIVNNVPEAIFDLVLLGMGPDGHTASLFPGHPLLQEKKSLISPISDSPKPPPQRITFTLPLICSARDIAFVCTGESKQEALKSVFKDSTEQPLPSALVNPTSFKKEGKVTWFVDSSAAGQLSGQAHSCM
eukprot:CAMPEP_0201492478 /NCGR_PEP_ID=MMETSP0151_2-20130828/33272_1 /ASSEMBLY_ACC=CAM_ASM_000257 /TAXON_ID=200890 /ORGANISM="Paramoeba atlantica, Strain 621/1 / CCAP 1560/9" /LENGTH=257 /DNA_ID=CAMNT_0047879313 /DNA_START=99 /DNA_END=872 /DNA_ORIENTATION=+